MSGEGWRDRPGADLRHRTPLIPASPTEQPRKAVRVHAVCDRRGREPRASSGFRRTHHGPELPRDGLPESEGGRVSGRGHRRDHPQKAGRPARPCVGGAVERGCTSKFALQRVLGRPSGRTVEALSCARPAARKTVDSAPVPQAFRTLRVPRRRVAERFGNPHRSSGVSLPPWRTSSAS